MMVVMGRVNGDAHRVVVMCLERERRDDERERFVSRLMIRE